MQNVLLLFGEENNNNSGGIGRLHNNPIVSNIISNFTNKLTNNHGIPGDEARHANNLIPNVISNLVNRTNDPDNNNFDINSIIGSLNGCGNAHPGST